MQMRLLRDKAAAAISAVVIAYKQVKFADCKSLNALHSYDQ